MRRGEDTVGLAICNKGDSRVSLFFYAATKAERDKGSIYKKSGLGCVTEFIIYNIIIF